MSANAVSHHSETFGMSDRVQEQVRTPGQDNARYARTPGHGSSDDLGPARGLIAGVLLGGVFWLGVAALVVLVVG